MTNRLTLEERAQRVIDNIMCGLQLNLSEDDQETAVLNIVPALREAVAERDREWSDTLWPENPEGAGPCEPSEAGAQIKALVAYAVSEERRALREIVDRRPAHGSAFNFKHDLLAALDAREKA